MPAGEQEKEVFLLNLRFHSNHQTVVRQIGDKPLTGSTILP